GSSASWRRCAGGRTGLRSASPTTAATPAARGQRVAGGFLALRVNSYRERMKSAVLEREQDPFHAAVRGFLGAQENARSAPGIARDIREDPDIFERFVEYQPAPGRRFRRADDLAVLRLPVSRADRRPAGEGRAPEDEVGTEGGTGGVCRET